MERTLFLLLLPSRVSAALKAPIRIVPVPPLLSFSAVCSRARFRSTATTILPAPPPRIRYAPRPWLVDLTFPDYFSPLLPFLVYHFPLTALDRDNFSLLSLSLSLNISKILGKFANSQGEMVRPRGLQFSTNPRAEESREKGGRTKVIEK